MALSLIAMTSSEPSGGSMRISACGRMIVRIACSRLMPSASAARIWPGRTEVSPARIGLGHIGAEMDAERRRRAAVKASTERPVSSGKAK